MRLIRSHGAGNDYLVLDRAPDGFQVTPARAVALCDRHTGVGGDGLLEPVPSTAAAAGLRIWNPDGSLAEKSGNGLRIFARWLADHRGFAGRFSIEVAAGVVHAEVAGDDVAVEMGAPTFEPAEIPTTRALHGQLLEHQGWRLRATAVGLGNPHCVILLDPEDGPLDALPWRLWGARLERDPLFPNRTNVQFARVLSTDRVEARVWERGAGETASSGSSACAIVAAARSHGRVGDQVAVEMPGGTLRVRVRTDGGLELRGPVEEVASISLSSTFVKKLMVIE